MKDKNKNKPLKEEVVQGVVDAAQISDEALQGIAGGLNQDIADMPIMAGNDAATTNCG